ncbi:TraK family protein [Bordetella bronchiseptica]|uniref:TraK family protein n=1 Tax=Bordetella bronchiseptica TaxID=518 RepID=UPI00123B2525|nr:TraK family protein [Bordetella bronchiseptica]QET71814.1 hypothetical protein FOB42_16495 [Bordetella bronchiseptica]
MSKRYSDVLAEWVEKRSKGKRRTDAAAVAFLAVKNDVGEALETGYAMKTIWKHMHETGRIQTGYEAIRQNRAVIVKNRHRVAIKPDFPTDFLPLSNARNQHFPCTFHSLENQVETPGENMPLPLKCQ